MLVDVNRPGLDSKGLVKYTSVRPGLAYQHAFDWLASSLALVVSSSACRACTVFAGLEMLKRLPDIPFLAPLPDELTETAASIELKPIVQDSLEADSIETLVWVDPQSATPLPLEQAAAVLRPGGYLYAITGGSLARFLVERREGRSELMSVNVLTRSLKQGGFRLVSSIGWHDPRAIAWHYVGVVAERIGRDDWADRCHYAMRRSFTRTVRWPWPVALVGLTLERVK